jgi:hypothetical protein
MKHESWGGGGGPPPPPPPGGGAPSPDTPGWGGPRWATTMTWVGPSSSVALGHYPSGASSRPSRALQSRRLRNALPTISQPVRVT